MMIMRSLGSCDLDDVTPSGSCDLDDDVIKIIYFTFIIVCLSYSVSHIHTYVGASSCDRAVGSGRGR